MKREKVAICVASFHIPNSNTMILPDDVDKEKISAQVENGVLNINLPKFTEQEKEKAKRFIDVK